MHQKRNWKPFRRADCTCGLPWPCLELRLAASRLSERLAAAKSWNAPTEVHRQVGRAGRLTPGQTHRGGGL
jgi:hypothetical protein